MEPLTKAYAEMCKDKRGTWYRIVFDLDAPITTNTWQGPFRDKTDAENAAEDYAKVACLELQWVS